MNRHPAMLNCNDSVEVTGSSGPKCGSSGPSGAKSHHQNLALKFNAANGPLPRSTRSALLEVDDVPSNM